MFLSKEKRKYTFEDYNFFAILVIESLSTKIIQMML